MNTVVLVVAAVLNTFGQTLALTFLLWLALRILQPHVNAAARHLIWWLMLVLIVVLPAIPRPAPVPLSRTQTPLQTVTMPPPIAVSAPLSPPASSTPITVTERPTAKWPYWLLAIWVTIFAQRMLGLVRSYFHLRGIKSRASIWNRPLPPIKRQASLLLSAEVSSPLATGFFRPAIILPDNLPRQLTDEQVNHVLLHESAHLARYDDWSNLYARILDTALALHPVAWFARLQIEREREIACDDWVVAQTGATRSYAESLAHMAELRAASPSSILATGIYSRPSRLRERIEVLLRHGRRFSPVAARIPLGTVAFVLTCLAVTGAMAPHWIAFAQRLEFEVASVKRNTTNGPIDAIPRRSGDLIMMHNVQPYSVIYYAYNLHGGFQMVDYVRLPDDWNWYDIDVRVPAGATEDQVRLMFQSLMEDRFKLKVNRETRDIPEYELSVANGKPKLTPSNGDGPMNVTIEDKTFPARPGKCSTSSWREGLHMVCHAATMETIAAQVGAELQAPVEDRTGLTGTYDLNVRYLSERQRLNADADPAPSFPDALRQALGLKLEKMKGPVEVLVIRHMEKPSEN